MFSVSIIVLLICMFVALFFLIYSEDIAKKIQAAGIITNLITLLILVIGFFLGRPEFVDIVLVFLLLNLVGLVGFLRILKQNKIGITSAELCERQK